MAVFYRLHTLTRRRLGVPVQPRRFFDLLRNRSWSPVSASSRPRRWTARPWPPSSAWYTRQTIVAKYQASDPDRRETGAGHLMHWEVMCAACDEGYRFYDLGRTDLDAEGWRVQARMGP